jgi:hypothetical protein
MEKSGLAALSSAGVSVCESVSGNGLPLMVMFFHEK